MAPSTQSVTISEVADVIDITMHEPPSAAPMGREEAAVSEEEMRKAKKIANAETRATEVVDRAAEARKMKAFHEKEHSYLCLATCVSFINVFLCFAIGMHFPYSGDDEEVWFAIFKAVMAVVFLGDTIVRFWAGYVQEKPDVALTLFSMCGAIIHFLTMGEDAYPNLGDGLWALTSLKVFLDARRVFYCCGIQPPKWKQEHVKYVKPPPSKAGKNNKAKTATKKTTHGDGKDGKQLTSELPLREQSLAASNSSPDPVETLAEVEQKAPQGQEQAGSDSTSPAPTAAASAAAELEKIDEAVSV